MYIIIKYTCQAPNYYGNLYYANLEKLERLTETLRQKIAHVDMGDDIENMFRFFGYVGDGGVYNFYTHMFPLNQAKGENLSGLGGVLGFTKNQREADLTGERMSFPVPPSSPLYNKNYTQQDFDIFCRYYCLPTVFHEMTHNYYFLSGKEEEFSGFFENDWFLNDRLLTVFERFPELKLSNINPAASLLNEVLATSFQGIFQEKLGYYHPSGRLYGNDLVNRLAFKMIPKVKKYIKEGKQIDRNFIIKFKLEALGVCNEISNRSSQLR